VSIKLLSTADSEVGSKKRQCYR